MKLFLTQSLLGSVLFLFPLGSLRADDTPKDRGKLVIQDAYILEEEPAIQLSVGYTAPGSSEERIWSMKASLGMEYFTSSIRDQNGEEGDYEDEDEYQSYSSIKSGEAFQRGFAITPKLEISADWNLDRKTIEELELKIAIFSVFSVNHWNYLKDYRKGSTFKVDLDLLNIGAFYENDDSLQFRKSGMYLDPLSVVIDKALKLSGIPILFKMGVNTEFDFGSFILDAPDVVKHESAVQIIFAPKIMMELGARFNRAFDLVLRGSVGKEMLCNQNAPRNKDKMFYSYWDQNSSWKFAVALRGVLGLPVDLEYAIEGEQINRYKMEFNLGELSFEGSAPYQRKLRQQVGIHVWL